MLPDFDYCSTYASTTVQLMSKVTETLATKAPHKSLERFVEKTLILATSYDRLDYEVVQLDVSEISCKSNEWPST